MKFISVFKFLIPIAIVVTVGMFFVSRSVPTAHYVEVARGVAIDSIPGTVQVTAEAALSIKVEYGGQVVASNMIRGEKISKGAVLMQLDTEELDLSIERVEIEHEAAKRKIEIGTPLRLELEANEEELEDMLRRYEHGGVREADLKGARRSVKKTKNEIALYEAGNEALMKRLENELKQLKRQRGQMTIRSPIDGIVTEVGAHVGERIAAGEIVAEIVSLARSVEMKVSEENFVGLRPGLPARVVFLGIDNGQFEASVERVVPAADSRTQRFTVYLDVKIDEDRLYPGLTGDATITLSQREGALLIPRVALVDDRALILEEGVVSERKVRVGFKSVTTVEILDGLSEGERVIAQDLHLWEPGDRARGSPIR